MLLRHIKDGDSSCSIGCCYSAECGVHNDDITYSPNEIITSVDSTANCAKCIAIVNQRITRCHVAARSAVPTEPRPYTDLRLDIAVNGLVDPVWETANLTHIEANDETFKILRNLYIKVHKALLGYIIAKSDKETKG